LKLLTVVEKMKRAQEQCAGATHSSIEGHYYPEQSDGGDTTTPFGAG
jgi:hypothetical protein